MGSSWGMAALHRRQGTRRQRNMILRVILLVTLIFVCYNSVVPACGLLRSLQFANCESFLPTEDVTYRELTPLEALSDSPKYGIAGDESPRGSRPDGSPGRTPAVIQHPAQVQTTIQSPKEPTALQDALEKVLSLLPDELHIKELLSPIQSTGETKIHEIALRARVLKQLLSAWETLHLTPSADGTMYIHDNILDALYRHPSIPGSLGLPLPQIIHSYESYRSLLSRLSSILFPWTSPYFANHMTLHASLYNAQRGLVFSAPNHQCPYMLTSIKSLRKLGCTLPIEVMYLGDEDLSEDNRELLESIPGVITRDLSSMVLEEGWSLQGWAAKPFALLLSSFREAMFIDADAIFVRNPEELFEDEAYKEEGALFFRDRLMMPESKRTWMQRILPRPVSGKARETRLWTGESAHMQESGVVVVDKWRHLVAMLLVTRLNGPDRDGDKLHGKVGVYDMVYGDKETFWLGWELVGDVEYAFHGGSAGLIGSSKAARKNEGKDAKGKSDEDGEVSGFKICGPQLLHLDRDDRPLWLNGWLLPNKFNKDHKSEPVDFEEFIIEPPIVDSPGSWQLGRDNVCCMTSDIVYQLTGGEKAALQMTIATAREVGAI